MPGLLVLATITMVSVKLSAILPWGDPLILTVLIGAMASNSIGTPKWANAGLSLHKRLLEGGIILLGAQLTLRQVAAAGPSIILLTVCTVTTGILVIEFLSRKLFRLEPTMASLLAAGSSICGVSAVIAIAASIDAREEQITYVAGAILIFDAITLVVFPYLGTLFTLSSKVYGIWVGLTMFSTGPVAAAGFAHSSAAGQWATLTKLVRNSFIGLVAVAYSINYATTSVNSNTIMDVRGIWEEFPKFIVGFVFMMVCANLGLFPEKHLPLINGVSEALFLLAFAGLGYDIRLSEMRASGVRPLIVLLVYLTMIGAVLLISVPYLL